MWVIQITSLDVKFITDGSDLRVPLVNVSLFSFSFIILFGKLFIGLCTLVGVNSHSAWTVRPSLGAMAVDPDEADREYISQNMDADLQFILSESGVSIHRQAAIARRYGSLRKFNAIGDDRPQIRTACLQDFAIPQDTPENRAEVASIVAAWETAKEFVAKEIELRAEAKVLGQPKILQSHERQSMIRAVERIHGCLGESETPSSDYLALKAEETELNEPVASPLDEIISKRDNASSHIQSTVDSSGHLRVTRTKNKARMPSNTEEYRKIMRLKCLLGCACQHGTGRRIGFMVWRHRISTNLSISFWERECWEYRFQLQMEHNRRSNLIGGSF